MYSHVPKDPLPAASIGKTSGASMCPSHPGTGGIVLRILGYDGS